MTAARRQLAAAVLLLLLATLFVHFALLTTRERTRAPPRALCLTPTDHSATLLVATPLVHATTDVALW